MRRTLRIAGCMVAGFVAANVLAWWMPGFLWDTGRWHWENRWSEFDATRWPGSPLPAEASDTWTVKYQDSGFTGWCAGGRLPDHSHVFSSVAEAGWPLRMWKGSHAAVTQGIPLDGPGAQWTFCGRWVDPGLGPRFRILVLPRPLWGGVTGNTLIFGIGCYALWSAAVCCGSQLRQRLARRHGECPQCRYPIRGVERCPECGLEPKSDD